MTITQNRRSTTGTPASGATTTDTVVTTHGAIEAEVGAAYHDGIREGIRLASEAYGRAVEGALHRPDGHGGPDLDVATRVIVRDLYARYLGVVVTGG